MFVFSNLGFILSVWCTLRTLWNDRNTGERIVSQALRKKLGQEWVDICSPPVPAESWAKFRSPQNVSGASQQNSGAAFSWSTEEAGDQNVKRRQWINKTPKPLK